MYTLGKEKGCGWIPGGKSEAYEGLGECLWGGQRQGSENRFSEECGRKPENDKEAKCDAAHSFAFSI